jgi:hypothetical protein
MSSYFLNNDFVLKSRSIKPAFLRLLFAPLQGKSNTFLQSLFLWLLGQLYGCSHTILFFTPINKPYPKTGTDVMFIALFFCSLVFGIRTNALRLFAHFFRRKPSVIEVKKGLEYRFSSKKIEPS